jgi:hypothetical protein
VKNACLRPRAPAVSGAAFIYRRTLNGKPCLRRRLDHISGGIPAAHRRSLIEGGFVVVVKVAATNKCLARSNKSRTGGKATNNQRSPTGSARNSPGAADWQDPWRVSAAGLSRSLQVIAA